MYQTILLVALWSPLCGCSKIAEAEAAVSVNEKKWLVMHMHVQLKLDELRSPPTLDSFVWLAWCAGVWTALACRAK
jgi:hypothetical protein